MDSITISIPAIDHQVVSALAAQTTETLASELAAIKLLREKFAPLAKHAGFVRIANSRTYTSSGQELTDDDYYYGVDGSAVFEAERPRLRALLAETNFTSPNDSEFTGSCRGDRLYLTAHGEWLRIERAGRWSSWQGAPCYWDCGDVLGLDNGDAKHGSIRILTDDQVNEEYALADVLKVLGKELAEMAKKLPERYSRLKQRAELAGAVIGSL